MEELGRQLQQLQATVEIQQAQIEEQRRCLEGESDESDSPYAENHHSQKQQFRCSDIKVEIPDFEGRLQPDEFVDWLQTVERKLMSQRAILSRVLTRLSLSVNPTLLLLPQAPSFPPSSSTAVLLLREGCTSPSSSSSSVSLRQVHGVPSP
ncbi:hypothetical protein SESBI_40568 [Sesbania bispinosa]|nr:hypothetical protein SESBI_40568 [Sesbania bispinosa]